MSDKYIFHSQLSDVYAVVKLYQFIIEWLL